MATNRMKYKHCKNNEKKERNTRTQKIAPFERAISIISNAEQLIRFAHAEKKTQQQHLNNQNGLNNDLNY